MLKIAIETRHAPNAPWSTAPLFCVEAGWNNTGRWQWIHAGAYGTHAEAEARGAELQARYDQNEDRRSLLNVVFPEWGRA